VTLNVEALYLDLAVHNRIPKGIKYVHVRIVVREVWVVNHQVLKVRVTDK